MLNYSYFNLVLNKESYLADFGSLSYRFKDVSTGHEKENKDIQNTETKVNNHFRSLKRFEKMQRK